MGTTCRTKRANLAGWIDLCDGEVEVDGILAQRHIVSVRPRIRRPGCGSATIVNNDYGIKILAVKVYRALTKTQAIIMRRYYARIERGSDCEAMVR